MSNAITMGIFWHLIGAASAACFYAPFKKVKKWSWETMWSVGGIVSWIILPWAISALLLPDFWAYYSSFSLSTLLPVFLFGAMWGIGNINYGLTMRYLGMSMGIGIAIGITLIVGTLMTPIINGNFDVLINTEGGRMTLLGVLVALIGVGIVTRAGQLKERKMGIKAEEFNLKKGLVLAVMCGIFSAGMSFAMNAAKPMHVQRVGKMVLNRNPDNFFAENEQAAFHPGHIVPGLDFTNDPLLQGRLFSYTDTQISRLGGPNFHEIPINRPTCPYHNFQRDGMHRMGIDTNPANYEPNSINDNWPRETPPGPKRGGFESYQERVEGNKVRERSPSFGEYYSHPRLFWLSQTPFEQRHIVDGFSFELSKVVRPYIRERVVDQLAHIDLTLAQAVAKNLGIELTDDQLNITPPPDVNGLKKPRRDPGRHG